MPAFSLIIIEIIPGAQRNRHVERPRSSPNRKNAAPAARKSAMTGLADSTNIYS